MRKEQAQQSQSTNQKSKTTTKSKQHTRKPLVRLLWSFGLYLLFITLGSTDASASSTTKPTLKKRPENIHKQYRGNIHANYFGNFMTRRGLMLGGEYALLQNDSHKWLLKGDLGIQIHPQNSVSPFLLISMGYRFTSDIGLFFDTFVGCGYLHAIGQSTSAGSAYFVSVGSTGLGWDFSRSHAIPLSLAARIQTSHRISQDRDLLSGVSLQTGISYLF